MTKISNAYLTLVYSQQTMSMDAVISVDHLERLIVNC
ncbi:MAG: hypothetical protein RLZZ04_1547 [Cyanobacteriota bacterium]|jgi:hypothetical protein